MAKFIWGKTLYYKRRKWKATTLRKGFKWKAIPINISNGSKLLINGRDVSQAINAGALSAALTGLPTMPTDSKLACGMVLVHMEGILLMLRLRSKLNEKLAFNAAASFVPGQDYQGHFEDTYSARLGFIFKLGEIDKSPSQINSELKKEINLLKNDKKNLLNRLVKLEKLIISSKK